MPDSNSGALPLGDPPMVGVTGLEPATSCTRNMRSTKLSYTPLWCVGLDLNQRAFDRPDLQSGDFDLSPTDTYLAGAAGIEPTLTVLETVVLPLNYTPMNGEPRI